MRLTVTTMVTVDGVMQGPGGPDEDRALGFDLGGWVAAGFDDEVGGFVTEIFERADAFLLGRRTYDIFAAYWPLHRSDDPVSDGLNRLPKHVVTTRPTDLAWENSHRVDGTDLVAAIGKLKEQPGGELQVHGSGRLIGSLQRAGLIDAYYLQVHPVILGRGQKLFAEGIVPSALRLTDSRTSPSGVALQTYETAGEPSFATVGA